MFEFEILLSNIIAPAAVVLVGMLAGSLLPAFRPPRIAAMFLTVAGVVAIGLAFALRNGFSLWPDDAWQKVPIAAGLVACAAIAVQWTRRGAGSAQAAGQLTAEPESLRAEFARLAALATSSAVAALLIFPRGEGWVELQSQLPGWMLAISLAVSLAWLGIAGCPPSVAAVVGFAMLPLLVATAFLTSLSFMKVTEPLIAIATVLGLSSIAVLRLPQYRQLLPLLIAPVVFATAAIIAHGQFYNFLDIPRGLYFFAMFSPAVVALAGRILQRKSDRLATGAVIGAALSLSMCIAYWVYLAGGFESADAW